MHARTALVAALAIGCVAARPVAVAAPPARQARPHAVATLPLDRMAAAERRLAEPFLRASAIHRRLPAESVTCDAALLDFLLTKPETLVDVWRVLGISRLALDPVAPGQWRLADGYGTSGVVRLLHHERTERGGLLVYHGCGGYDGPLAPRRLSGACLVVVRHAPAAAAADGRERHAVQLDAFLDVDGVGLEIVTRTLQPLIAHSAAANLHEICLFVSQFSAAAARQPAAIARLAERLPRTDPRDRAALVEVACRSARLSTPSAEPAAADTMQAELAARWLPTGSATGGDPGP